MPVNIKCPKCGHPGPFRPLAATVDAAAGGVSSPDIRLASDAVECPKCGSIIPLYTLREPRIEESSI